MRNNRRTRISFAGALGVGVVLVCFFVCRSAPNPEYGAVMPPEQPQYFSGITVAPLQPSPSFEQSDGPSSEPNAKSLDITGENLGAELQTGSDSSHGTAPDSTAEPAPGQFSEYFAIVMMGDCAIASDHLMKGSAYAYENVVKDDYAYPFSIVKPLYEGADFVIVNLECVISDYNVPQEKAYRLRAPPEYVNILLEGGIDFVTLGNNHTMDYGQKGYTDTQEILSDNGIGFARNGGWSLFVTESGLTIGVYSKNLASDADVKKAASDLKNAGAELIIMALHWGDEGSYRTTSWQKQVGHAAIDAGAHIVMGTHPHTLQELEEYHGGFIYYSLANWTFGANTNPRDKDSVLAKVTVKRDIGGEISVIGTENIPFSVSGSKTINDYRPTPYELDSEDFQRTLSKLSGTFTGPDLDVSYSPVAPEETSTEPDGEEAADNDKGDADTQGSENKSSDSQPNTENLGADVEANGNNSGTNAQTSGDNTG